MNNWEQIAKDFFPKEFENYKKSISDGRRPDSVIFTNIETDVLRRDLTCNALFYDLKTGEIVDLVGGVDDINKNVIRSVGNPHERFKEDKLRKLRTIRFVARFDGFLSVETDNALMQDSDLSNISGERIRDEFIKGIKSSKSVKDFIYLLDKYDLLKWIFDDLVINTQIQEPSDKNDYLISIAQLLSYNGPKVISKKLNELKYTYDEIKIIAFLISLKTLDFDTAVVLKRLQKNSNVTNDQIRTFCNFIDTTSEKIIESFINFNLTVSGDDLMTELDIKAGPELGKKIQEIETENFLKLLKC